MTTSRAALLCLAFSTSTWAGPPATPFFESDDPPTEKVMALDDAQLSKVLLAQLSARGLRAKNLVTGAEGIDGLPREVRAGLLMGISSQPGAEVNVLVEGAGGLTPVEVLQNEGVLAYRVGAARASLYGAPVSAEALQKKYGIGPLVDDGATWDDATRSALELALAQLSPRELKALAGVPFHRLPKEPTGKVVSRGTPMALYRFEGTAPRIELYDLATQVDRRKFVGAVDAPRPYSAAMLVHEMAHAVSRSGTVTAVDEVGKARAELEAAAAAFNAGQKKFNEDRATFMRTKDPELKKSLEAFAASAKVEAARIKELQRRWQDLQASTSKQGTSKASPFEASLNTLRPYTQAPTPYGRVAAWEAFAESFWLWKLDPEGLERAAPGVKAWFESAAYADLLPQP